jgi:hypothetical protein
MLASLTVRDSTTSNGSGTRLRVVTVWNYLGRRALDASVAQSALGDEAAIAFATTAEPLVFGVAVAPAANWSGILVRWLLLDGQFGWS